ncbi:HrpA-like RNA helicase [Hokovirus HKV1]|uniref:RNA helicase n=1 Tax=Hokovirus HKV1 TaxID=1977638 RepID=A0A1V0SGN4_9VIRU|nr:HrpA-like RNA helicase [Hokovirus HKV1]
MAKYFKFSQIFINEINTNVIKKEFPILNNSDSKLLLTYLIDILELIVIKYSFRHINYEKVLKKNSYEDIIGCLYMLLPFLNKEIKSTKLIKNIQDIYTLRQDNETDLLKQIEPEYIYSNLQYGRIDRTTNKEINYHLEHLHNNYVLLKETIINTANKLYVNWIDVYPIPCDHKYFQSLELFKNTKKVFEKKHLGGVPYYDPFYDNESNVNVLAQLYAKNYAGLDISNIYNTLRNDLYSQIQDIKWLIYDVKFDSKQLDIIKLVFDINNNKIFEDLQKYENNTITIYEILNLILPLGKIIEANNFYNDPVKWHQTEMQQSFKNKIMELKHYKSQNTTDCIKKIIIYITKFFDSYNKNNDEYINNGYVKLPETMKKEVRIKNYEITENNMDNIYKTVQKSFSSIRDEWLFNYIAYCLFRFKKTWYGYKIERDNKIDVIVHNAVNFKLTFKNFYNFTKAIVSYDSKYKKRKQEKKQTKKRTFVQYEYLWRSIEKKEKLEILSKINDNSKEQWFNITNNILLVHDNLLGIKNKETVNTIMQLIKEKIYDNITRIIFETMTFNGILSIYQPDFKFTQNKSNYSELIEEKIKNFKNNKLLENCFYYLNNKKYTGMKFNYYNKNTASLEQKEYLEYMTTTHSKEKYGSWNEVYAMNWISQILFYHKYLNNRVIYVTGGTGVGKSTQVPKLLLYCLKFLDYKYEGKIICSQPRIPPTKKSSETISGQLGVPIKETSKITLDDIETNNYYVQMKYAKKKEIHVKNTKNLTLTIATDGIIYEVIKNNPLLKKKIYTNNTFQYKEDNEYDIVLIDEAHEHNKNMDMSLTLLNYSLYHNNSIKLVIVSATMDKDELKYRRFFRNINDNLIYPHNVIIREHQLDRINVDRRIHIFSPIATNATQYEIKETYDIKVDDIYNLVNDLIRENKGDILIFQPGVNEIHKMVSKLNEMTPDNVIAIPYHGNMDTNKKSFIEDLNDEKRAQIIYPKNVEYDNKFIDKKSIKYVPQGTYTRVIIVATNLAEASITINSLKYVIDTGTRKVLDYNYYTRTDKVVKSFITEARRKQRKGRVGRKSSGSVYYTYKEGEMYDNVDKYDITTTNLASLLYSLLKNCDDVNLIMNLDINNILINNKNTDINFIKNMVNRDIYKIIKKQYYYKNSNKVNIINYYGNNKHYDYINNIEPHKRFITGYQLDTINDKNCSFYIIHPDETIIYRNILGNIVKCDEMNLYNERTKLLKSDKIKYSWNYLIELNTVYKKDKDICKTVYGQLFFDILKNNKFFVGEETENEKLEWVNMILYSSNIGCLKEIIQVLTFLYVAKISLKNMAFQTSIKKNNTDYLIKLLNLYKNDYGDITSIYDITNEINTSFNIKMDLNIKQEDVTQKIIKAKSDYFNGKLLDKQIFNIFNKLDTQGILTKNIDKLSNLELENIKEFFINIQNIKQEYDYDKIYDWCKSHYLNVSTVKNYILYYKKFTNNITNILLNNEYKSIINKNIINNLNPKQKIINTFLFSSGYKLLINYHPGFLYAYFPMIDNSENLLKIDSVNNMPLTFARNYNNYIYAESLDPFDKKISLIINLTPKIIQENVPFIFSPSKIKYNYSLKYTNLKYYKDIMTTFYNDMLRSYSSQIYLTLMKIHDQDKLFVDSIKKYIEHQKQILNNK